MVVYVIKSANGYVGIDDDTISYDYNISFGYNQAHYGKYIKRFLGKNVLVFPNKESALKFKSGLANQNVEVEKYFVPSYTENLEAAIGNTCKNTMYIELW